MSISYNGPVVLIVMDGVGLSDKDVGNAVTQANKTTLDACMKNHPMLRLQAHGTAVGLPSDDDMGNSEVGPQRDRSRTGVQPGSQAGQ